MGTDRTISRFLLFVLILITLFGKPFGDNVAPSSKPPNNLSSKNVPQFVNIGFDDNNGAKGVEYILNLLKNKKNPVGPNNNPLTYDGTPARVVFYVTAEYTYNKELFKQMVADGHEVGNHTVKHENCGSIVVSDEYPPKNYTVAQWEAEMNACTKFLVDSVGMDKKNIVGFRIPFLSYNNNCFTAIKNTGLIYDCSLDGGSFNVSGSSYNWPYTMDKGSPGTNNIGNHPGVWQVPTHYVIQTNGQQITGLDYNMIERTEWGCAAMTKAEYLGALKKTLDLRYNGNRAPFTFGAHSQYYGEFDPPDSCPNITLKQRQEVLAEFIDYALSKPDVRVVTTANIIKWMRNPVGLDASPVIQNNALPFAGNFAVKIVGQHSFKLSLPGDGFYTCGLFSVKGVLIKTVLEGIFAQGTYMAVLNRTKSRLGYI